MTGAVPPADPTDGAGAADESVTLPDEPDTLEDKVENETVTVGDARAVRLGKPPAPWKSLSRRAKIALFGSGGAAVVIIVALALILGVFLPKQRAESAYDTAVANYNAAQSALTAQIAVAQDLAGRVGADQVKDPTVLDILATALAAANGLVVAAPVVAGGTDTSEQQTTDLTNQTAEMQVAVDSLQSAITAVQQSRVDWAVDVLTAAVTAAQAIYDASAGGLVDDESLRTTLQSQLDAANQALAAAQTITITVPKPSAAPANPSNATATIPDQSVAVSPPILSTDVDQIVTSLTDLVATLNIASQAVADDQAKVTNAVYTYVLVLPDGMEFNDARSPVVTGSNAAGNYAGWYYGSVKIIVQGDRVVVGICGGGAVDFPKLETCGGGFDRVTINSRPGAFDVSDRQGDATVEIWTGNRDGTTAIVNSGDNPFDWAAITFAGPQPQAAAVKFIGGSNCQRSDGTYGYWIENIDERYCASR